MASPDFERSSALATELLYKQNIENRILSIQRLKYENKKIFFNSIQNYAQVVKKPLTDFLSEDNQVLKDGCTLILGNEKYLVLYNNQITHWEHLNWTLAHEIGHIYLNHKKDGPIEEIEAHFFAAQLLMPEYSIYMMAKERGIISHYDIVEIFGVSEMAAIKRLQTINKKTVFRSNAIDKEIWNVQKQRVDLYYELDKDPYAYRNCLEFMFYMNNELNNEMASLMY